MRATRLLILATATFALVGALATVPAQAEPSADAQLLVVLDASSSMLEPASDGGTRADAAKNALLDVVETLDPDQRVGLRQFGATVSGLNNPDSCTDSQLTVPIATDNRQALRDAAHAYLPYGETPIGHALQQAGADLGSSGQRTILLISDGESNCQPDPCGVAGELAAQGIDLTIHVVGFDVSGAARDALVCIANTGRGQYYDVSDAAQLTAVFDQVSTRAFEDVTLDGKEVLGASQGAPTTTLTTGTTYLTYLPEAGSSLFYTVDRTIENSTIRVQAMTQQSGIFPTNLWAFLRADQASGTCGMDHIFPSTWGGTWSLRTLLVEGGDSEDCLAAETFDLEIRLDDEVAASGAPLQIVIHEEPPVRNPGQLPAYPQTAATWVVSPDAASTATVAGTTFETAPLVTSGRYTFDLLPEETRLLAINVDWGQSLQVRSRRDPLLVPGEKSGTEHTLFSPVGHIPTSSSFNVRDAPGLPTGEATAHRFGPVTYQARSEFGTYDAYAEVAGTFYVAVTARECSRCNPNAPATVTVDLFVDGAVNGVPEYVVNPIPGAPVSPDPSEIESSTTPPSTSPITNDAPPVAESQGGIPLALPIALGTVGIGLLGGGGLLLARRRRAELGVMPGSSADSGR